MEYAIFPMKIISISQRYSTGHKAMDIVGSGTGKEDLYAPCGLKVLKVLPRSTTNFFNTVLFGTCDANGNPAAVMCEDGVARILTIGCTHMDTSDFETFGYYEGKYYPSGSVFYREGNEGISTGNHVHLDVGLGWQYEKVQIDGGWHLRDTMIDDNKTLIGNTFYQLQGFNTIGGQYGTNGYTFKTVNSRTVSSNFIMQVTGGIVELKTDVVNGSVNTHVPNGNAFQIIGLYSWIAADGYKWGYGKYNGNEGFFRYDPAIMHPVGPCLNYKMILFGSAARIRATVQGTILTTVSNGGTIQILEFLPSKASDGYYWCKGIGNGVEGYFQYDPAVMFPTND